MGEYLRQSEEQRHRSQQELQDDQPDQKTHHDRPRGVHVPYLADLAFAEEEEDGGGQERVAHLEEDEPAGESTHLRQSCATWMWGRGGRRAGTACGTRGGG